MAPVRKLMRCVLQWSLISICAALAPDNSFAQPAISIYNDHPSEPLATGKIWNQISPSAKLFDSREYIDNTGFLFRSPDESDQRGLSGGYDGGEPIPDVPKIPDGPPKS